MTEHPGSRELMNFVNPQEWDKVGIPFSEINSWERWGLLGVLSDYVLRYTQGDIVEIGICESSIYFSWLAGKYNRQVYHCDLQQSIFTNCRTVEGYFHPSRSHLYCGPSNDFFKDTNLPPIALGFIDGCHEYEIVRKDFWNLFPHMVENEYIFLHDTYPPTEEWLGPSACGTVYQLRQELELKPRLMECFTFTKSAWNVGLTMIRKKKQNLPHYQMSIIK